MPQKLCKLCSLILKIRCAKNLLLSTEDCFLSCQTVELSCKFRILKEKSDKIDTINQTQANKNTLVNKFPPTILSTSLPSGISIDETTANEQNPRTIKPKLFPSPWSEIFDSELMALLTKQDLALKKINKATDEEQKKHISQMGNYYKPYNDNLHVNGGCL